MLTKQDTKVLKGVSILIMIWLHVFLDKENVDLLECSFYIGDTPLVTLIRNFCGICIYLYLFLGGYGLYITYKKRNLGIPRRVFLLYLNYWIMLLLMLPVGHFINPINYPGSFSKFIFNFIAWDCSYNSTWWFLFPYILIIISSKFLFKLLDKYGGLYLFVFTYGINLVKSYTISRYGEKYLYDNLLVYIPFLYIHLLNAFYSGAIFAKYDLFNIIKNRSTKLHYKDLSLCLLIMLLVLFKGYITTSVVNIYVVVVLFVFIYCIDRPQWLDKVLVKLGEGSTDMWYVHAFICFYFLHDFTYSLKYPIIAYLFVIICSYVLHIIINTIFSMCKYHIDNTLFGPQEKNKT